MLHVAVALALFAASSPSSSSSKGSSSYDDLRAKAVVVERLSSTVAALVGVCPDGLMVDEIDECKKNLGTAAKQWAGKSVVVSTGAIDPQFMSFERRDAETAKLVWAPLLDLGNELAMTLGRPEKLSSSGTIVVARKPFAGPSDPALLDSDLQRAAKTGNIAVEMVGTFGKPWQLQGGGRIVRGLSFEPTAIRFVHVRTGKVLVELTNLK